MPMVGNKKFAYSDAGKRLAAKYAQKMGADKPYRGAMAPSNPAGFPKRDQIVSRSQQSKQARKILDPRFKRPRLPAKMIPR